MEIFLKKTRYCQFKKYLHYLTLALSPNISIWALHMKRRDFWECHTSVS